jgi:hypothetical protein
MDPLGTRLACWNGVCTRNTCSLTLDVLCPQQSGVSQACLSSMNMRRPYLELLGQGRDACIVLPCSLAEPLSQERPRDGPEGQAHSDALQTQIGLGDQHTASSPDRPCRWLLQTACHSCTKPRGPALRAAVGHAIGILLIPMSAPASQTDPLQERSSRSEK